MLFTELYYLFPLYSCARAMSIRSVSHMFPARDLFQFNETGTWLENIAVRSNGDLLTTMLIPTASLYILKRPYSATREFSLLHTFDNATGLLGITEISNDNFAILSAEMDNASNPVPGSSTIWGVSFSNDQFKARRISRIPDAILPNGITSIPDSSVVLIADSIGGTIIRCDALTETCETVLKCTETAPTPDVVNSIGINGLHYRNGYIYWSNSDLVSIFRIPVDKHGYPADNAKVESVGKVDALFIDDFVEDYAGEFYVAAGTNNTIVELQQNGSSKVVAGSLTDLTVAGCTATAFGRTVHDSRTLYVVTNGGIQAPVNGKTEPAKIVALDTIEST
ncbi:hypothetical protein F4859DRAFT_494035 [Xylaria cf. heliscus]|nr:hypothetical protein F4859DRAFT_494035 [Xylaria cf. heliscus]